MYNKICLILNNKPYWSLKVLSLFHLGGEIWDLYLYFYNPWIYNHKTTQSWNDICLTTFYCFISFCAHYSLGREKKSRTACIFCLVYSVITYYISKTLAVFPQDIPIPILVYNFIFHFLFFFIHNWTLR